MFAYHAVFVMFRSHQHRIIKQKPPPKSPSPRTKCGLKLFSQNFEYTITQECIERRRARLTSPPYLSSYLHDHRAPQDLTLPRSVVHCKTAILIFPRDIALKMPCTSISGVECTTTLILQSLFNRNTALKMHQLHRKTLRTPFLLTFCPFVKYMKDRVPL